MKRLLDIFVASTILLLTGPFLAIVCLLIWLQDFHSPLYMAPRVGRGGKDFRIVKLRSMVINADRTGVNSTGASDKRITPIGHFIRRFKLDELSQMLNVLMGDMSLVGPRPNTRAWGTELYTDEEMRLLSVRPGITDFASIVFSDEGDILKDQAAPDLAYNQLIRPWKSRLGIFYVERHSLLLDVQLILLTALVIVNRRDALERIQEILRRMGADAALIKVSGRVELLIPHPPPGMTKVVT